jgi:hypothetical protein
VSTTEFTPEATLSPRVHRRTLDHSRTPYLGLTLTLLFLTAAGVQNAIVLTWINVTGGNLSQPGTIYGLALVFAQQGLVALYCSFSRQHIAWRTAVFLAAMFVSGDLASRYDGRTSMQGTWMLIMLIHGLFVVAGACWARIVGLRFQLAEERDPGGVRWQFTLLRLFAVTTLAAVLLGIFSYLRIDFEHLDPMLLEAVVLGVLTLQVSFCVLMSAKFFTIIKMGFAGVCVATTLLTFTARDLDALSSLWLTLLHSLMTHAAMSIVQQAGYRLVEPEKQTKPGSP